MSVTNLIKEIQALTEKPPAPDAISPEEQKALLAGLDKVKSIIETPIDAAVRIVLGGYEHVALRIGIEMGIFNVMAAAGDLSVSEIAEQTRADPLLISRIMRLLAAMDVFEEVEESRYRTNPLTLAFSDGSPLHHTVLHLATATEVLVKLPAYLRRTKYQNPSSATDGPWHYAMNTKLNFFEWIKTDPVQAAAFNTHMEMHRMVRGQPWYTYFPVEEKLMGVPSTRPLFVDVGGNVGKDIHAFHQKFPQLTGRLVLEDLPQVIEHATGLDPIIETVAHDFFTPQPELARGAKCYMLSIILHDWPDHEAKVILQHIKEAMDEDSILLLDENALPETEVPLFKAKADFVMMSFFAAMDRTTKQFVQLLDEAGFELVRIWRPNVITPESGSLFEAALKK